VAPDSSPEDIEEAGWCKALPAATHLVRGPGPGPGPGRGPGPGLDSAW